MQGTAEFEQRMEVGSFDGAGAFRRLASCNGASENDQLGRAYLESSKKLSVSDSVKLEVRAGLRKDSFHGGGEEHWATRQRRNSCT